MQTLSALNAKAKKSLSQWEGFGDDEVMWYEAMEEMGNDIRSGSEVILVFRCLESECGLSIACIMLVGNVTDSICLTVSYSSFLPTCFLGLIIGFALFWLSCLLIFRCCLAFRSFRLLWLLFT